MIRTHSPKWCSRVAGIWKTPHRNKQLSKGRTKPNTKNCNLPSGPLPPTPTACRSPHGSSSSGPPSLLPATPVPSPCPAHAHTHTRAMRTHTAAKPREAAAAAKRRDSRPRGSADALSRWCLVWTRPRKMASPEEPGLRRHPAPRPARCRPGQRWAGGGRDHPSATSAHPGGPRPARRGHAADPGGPLVYRRKLGLPREGPPRPLAAVWGRRTRIPGLWRRQVRRKPPLQPPL